MTPSQLEMRQSDPREPGSGVAWVEQMKKVEEEVGIELAVEGAAEKVEEAGNQCRQRHGLKVRRKRWRV